VRHPRTGVTAARISNAPQPAAAYLLKLAGDATSAGAMERAPKYVIAAGLAR
jgi:hypothetical protein